MNKEEKRVAESYLILYFSMKKEKTIEKRIEQLNIPSIDENVGGSKSSNPKSLEFSIVRKLDDNQLKFYNKINYIVDEALNEFDGFEKSVIKAFYDVDDYKQLGRNTSKQVADKLHITKELASSIRKSIISSVSEKNYTFA